MRPNYPSAVISRALAVRAITRVLVDRRFLDATLADLRQTQQREAPDWPLIQELSYGTLRWYHQLAAILERYLTRPLKPKDADVRALLLIGLYQLRHMRVAEHAAVDATVAAVDALHKPWAKGLINACLRTMLRNPDPAGRALEASDEARYSHPTWLIDAVRRDYPDTWKLILAANNERPPMTLRVNLARIAAGDYLARLNRQGLNARAHARVASALVLEAAVPVEQLPGFEQGLVSVQDAAAQYAATWLDAQPNQRVLDACAAPGGKAAHILERTPALAELTAVDVDPDRLERARANLARLGLSARLITGDAAEPANWWDGRPYDRILVDAPCSATGVIRRHPDIKVRRQSGDLKQLSEAQARVLSGVWPCLAPGGKLLYATCSILGEENALQLRSFLARHRDAVARPVETGAGTAGLQIVPGEDDMDGFYYACVRKA